MKIVVAIDSFKGSVSSLQAGAAAKSGILRAIPDASVFVLPLADGGEGTFETIASTLGGKKISLQVTGPLAKSVAAQYGIVPKKNLAIIEISQAAGLPLVPQKKRNPLNTTTRGVGELILHALDKGVRNFLIGIGGSSTNDGGIGMLSALGIKFKDKEGKTLFGFGRDVQKIFSIDASGLDKRLLECEIKIACDVQNPLCGKNGASKIFGPQKGALPQVACEMDASLKNYALKTAKIFGKDFSRQKGAGAAGGLGFAFASYLNAKLQDGVSLVLQTIDFLKIAKNADFVLTGEGRLDGQTVMGKAPGGAAKAAKKASPKCKVIALCGAAAKGAEKCNQNGIDAFFPILREPVLLKDAMESGATLKNIRSTAEQIFRLLK